MLNSLKKFERRHIRHNGMYGWQEGKAWWDYCCPSYYNGNGADKAGWGSYRTAIIYEGYHANGQHFLAIFEGCHWELVVSTKTWERRWSPIWDQFKTLDEAMDFCENLMVEHQLIPPFED
jgi:hypothetical protein